MVDPKHIGTEFPPFSYVVESENVRAFAETIGDTSPAYAATEGDAFVTPPTFGTTFMLQGAGDMLWRELEKIGVNLLRMLHSEQEYEYLAPVAPGDTIRGQSRVADVYTKSMRALTLEFIVTETQYTNQRDEPVLREVLTLIVRHEDNGQ